MDSECEMLWGVSAGLWGLSRPSFQGLSPLAEPVTVMENAGFSLDSCTGMTSESDHLLRESHKGTEAHVTHQGPCPS